jgi:hypothetical protein
LLGTAEGILLDGAVDSRALEILPNLMGPAHQQIDALEERSKLPWYKRPSAAWWAGLPMASLSHTYASCNRLLVGTFMGAIAISTTIAPRIEIFIKLACQVRPALGTDQSLQFNIRPY